MPAVGEAGVILEPRSKGAGPVRRVIIGLDPGSAIMGFGVVEQSGNRLRPIDFGVVRTPKGIPVHRRLDLVFTQVSEILERHRPEAAAVESLFFNVNARTALAVGQARGVALLACARAGCELFEYTPQQVKQGVVGYGSAEKTQVQEMVRVLLGLADVPRPDDAADALGVAICHAHTSGMLRSIEASLNRNRPARS
jgi:crossover junction endodeoxyribonuclease RuvC